MRLQLVTLAAGVAVVAAVHLVPVRVGMERHLTAEAENALAAEGLTGVDVDVSGLEAMLSGSVTAPTDVDRALNAVVAVDAIASVEASLDVATTPTEQAPVEEAPVEEAPVQETPVEGAPVDEAPVEQAPVEEVEVAAQQARDALAAVPPITFLQNSVVLTAEGEQAVAQIAGVMAAAPPSLEFRVEAHSDLAGPDDFNRQLSIRRAATVRSALVGLGISRARVTSVGLGESQPLVVPEVTEEDRLTNRRIEIVVETAGS